jgi:hypothetical protein
LTPSWSRVGIGASFHYRLKKDLETFGFEG